MKSRNFDVVVLGAGAAGLFCAAEAGRRGRRVLVVDHARAPGEKIRISGGGRCNFTNIHASPGNFLSANPHFCISALKRFTAADFVARVDARGIAWHEKKLGQLFCDGPATQIVAMLTDDLAGTGGTLELATSVEDVARRPDGFDIRLSSGPVACSSLVIATGGKSIPRMGATGFAYRVAEQFGLAVTETRPGLVPLTFEPNLRERIAPLAGVSADARVSGGDTAFDEALLFTHRGLSGPAILQVSSYWREGDAIAVDLAPGIDIFAELRAARRSSGRQEAQTVLSRYLPRALAQFVVAEAGMAGPVAERNDAALRRLAELVHDWQVKPAGSEGYRTAEVTLGGVDTAGLDQKTMEAKSVPGLHFIGEAVDVTGWLGGYNFQWAWSSGWAAGQAV
ncbi:NAD(P)/FAD-dependent oxidoreductase [Oricola thermophila]|uniref:NAD(P)/FAD-dependent oxidoreductase n=1 Tax=Oricola thermophila TaxID=2742145 RepID=A0A6N1VGZ5_9HYPH|nr:NAD(P)/FAD-dependent oxidoreductase [Oricola thermophila]QKV19753.1 NAD(P)/FAD-dependent oxidoreductase [Oricola thermophila]